MTDKTQDVIHLSFTGFYAGVRLCGVSKAEGPKAWHAMYATDEQLAEVCAECKRIWETEDE